MKTIHIVVAGEAGAGKSTIIAEIQNVLQRSGVTVSVRGEPAKSAEWTTPSVCKVDPEKLSVVVSELTMREDKVAHFIPPLFVQVDGRVPPSRLKELDELLQGGIAKVVVFDSTAEVREMVPGAVVKMSSILERLENNEDAMRVAYAAALGLAEPMVKQEDMSSVSLEMDDADLVERVTERVLSWARNGHPAELPAEHPALRLGREARELEKSKE